MSDISQAKGVTEVAPSKPGTPARTLSVFFVMMLSVAMVVGMGVFQSPTLIAMNAGNANAIYLAWIVGGVISLIGALCYAELATAFPSAGGEYHFQGKAYGPRVAFLSAWARLAVINTTSIAGLGFVLGNYLHPLVAQWMGWPEINANMASALWAVGAIVLLTWFNLLGTRKGEGTNLLLTFAEIGGLLLLIAAGIAIVAAGTPPETPMAGGEPPNVAAFAGALVFVMLAFGGWNEIATLSAEVRDEKRGMVKALVGSIIIITALYILVTWAFLRGLGVEGLASAQAPASELMNQAFGPAAQVFTVLAVSFAVISSINATIMVGARTTYAAANDFKGFSWIGTWNAARGAPTNAIWIQAAVALALVGFGASSRNGFEALVAYSAPFYWGFMMLTGLSVIVLRLRDKTTPRPFRVPLFPVLPVLFCVAAFAMMISGARYALSLPTGPLSAGIGIAVLVSGIFLALSLKRT
jgi:basic amino acid/polyamine antiporter, APA family